MQFIEAEDWDVSFRLLSERISAAWTMVVMIGISAIAIGVYQHLFPPARA